jgi:hypothetical protein
VKTIAIIADDKIGLLADISYILAKSKINIESLSVDVVGNKAIITMNLSDIVRGRECVESAGYKVEDPAAIIVKLKDQPGELSNITAMLSKEGVNIINAKILAKDGTITIMGMVTDKPKKAAVLLKPYLVMNEAGPV